MEKLEQHLECPVCLEKLKKPVKILPCLHSFCQTCLQSISQNKNKYSCPLCRIEYSSPIESLPDNFFIHGLLETMVEIEKKSSNLPNNPPPTNLETTVEIEKKSSNLPNNPPPTYSLQNFPNYSFNFQPNVDYRIRAKHSSLVLDACQGGKFHGSIIQYPFHGGNNQRWYFTRNGDGSWIITSKNSRKVLDFDQRSRFLCEYQYHGGENQKWSICVREDGSYCFFTRQNGFVMDVKAASAQPNARVQAYPFRGNKNQAFFIEPC